MSRPISRLAEPDQWARCSHQGTALVDRGRGIELAWSVPESSGTSVRGVEPAGLAIDRWGRAYRSDPSAGRVVVLPRDRDSVPPGPGALIQPGGLAIDAAQRLYVAEAKRVDVIDLWGQRLLKEVPVHNRGGRVLDVATQGCQVLALVDGPPVLARLTGRRDFVTERPLRSPAPGLRPTRLTILHTGRPLVLWTDPDTGRGVIADPNCAIVVEAPGARDLEAEPDGVLVVARGPGQPFLVWALTDGEPVGLEPRRAEDFDGAAICRDFHGEIAHTTPTGIARSVGSAAVYTTSGSVISYRLDSGTPRTRWGRIFLDACIPPRTEVRLGFLTSDEEAVVEPMHRTPPAHGLWRVQRPERTPPLPPAAHLYHFQDSWPLFRRPTGREEAWAQIAGDDPYDTFEAPVMAPPGRFLWLCIVLTGTQQSSPRVREVRVEHPGHNLADMLPKAWTRTESEADFLQRLLAPAEGMLMELDEQARTREILLAPDSIPQEALEWLGGLLGIVLDRRWPLTARRKLVKEAFDLYRTRGNVASLQRILTLYLRRNVSIVENWRLRGLGGAVLGPAGAGPQAPFVAQTGHATEPLGRFAVGGRLPGEKAVLGADTDVAHQFTVILPMPLDAEQRGVVETVIETHKPAHTTARLCDYGEGMRIGTSRVGITAFVAEETGWGQDIVGQVLLGTDGIIGIPDDGARVGEVRVGAVRVR